MAGWMLRRLAWIGVFGGIVGLRHLFLTQSRFRMPGVPPLSRRFWKAIPHEQPNTVGIPQALRLRPIFSICSALHLRHRSLQRPTPD